jgi:exodeoxyribonuclease V alpha subunit
VNGLYTFPADFGSVPGTQSPSSRHKQISVAGWTEVLVDRVTFHNPENGFCVLPVKARGQRDLITVLGHAAMISAGECVQASGSWVNDRTHGVQFRAAFLKATAPTHPPICIILERLATIPSSRSRM